jgi:MoaA/NifB/PqqE/SkfB family radical SAM enzyme
VVDARPGGRGESRLGILRWLAWGPWLAQVVVTRKCNLTCGYCTEYDRTSEPVPFDVLAARLAKLRALRAWAVCLTGGEPTLHPRLVDLVAEMRRLGIPRREMITNGTLLTRDLVRGLNEAGLTNLQISVDGVTPNEVTVKTLKPLRKNLELLAAEARFRVVMSGVVGSTAPGEVLEVVRFAREHGFTPRVLLLHDEAGQVRPSPEELTAYHEAQQWVGRGGREAGDYGRRLAETGRAPFRCRAGARYLYVDEFGRVNWCAQTRGIFAKDLLSYGFEDLREQFETPKACNEGCSLGCVRSTSKLDAWRRQGGERVAPVTNGDPA